MIDENEKQILVKHPPRMEWEKSYTCALIDALRPCGDVLEVGFGPGYSATRIQTYRPKSHTIIEPIPEIAGEAKQWAKNHSNVLVIQDTWQNAISGLGTFDAIFFNDCSCEENTINVLEHRESGLKALSKGKELLRMVREKIPHLTITRYSDSDVEAFYEQVGQFHIKKLSRFLYELKCNGQISEEQYENTVKKYCLEKNESKTGVLMGDQQSHRIFTFFKICLEKHMHKGSRFSCFSSNPTSKYENPQFFEHIITDPNLDYQEQSIPVTVPSSCEYYKFDKALVMVIEKLS